MLADDQIRVLTSRVEREVTERIGQGVASGAEDDVVLGVARQVLAELTAGIGGVDEGDLRAVLSSFQSEMLGLGPLEPLLADARITEIMVQCAPRSSGSAQPPRVFVEIDGVLSPAPLQGFRDVAHLRRIISRIAQQSGRSCTAAHPIMDARLADGSRVEATDEDISPDGPTLTIRKFKKGVMSAPALVANGTCSAAAMAFLKSCVEAHTNILVTGGTGSGKTTFLNVLTTFVPSRERVVLIEDPAEIQITLPNVVRWEARHKNTEGQGEVSIQDLVVASLRARPDRIVVGEVRAEEAIDMLQAMTTGHDGSLTTVHANDPSTCFLRLRTMVQLGRPNMTVEAIDAFVASAVDLVVHVERDCGGRRHVSSIVAVEGYGDGVIVRDELFRWEPREERLVPTGSRPSRVRQRIEFAGSPYQASWFRTDVRGW